MNQPKEFFIGIIVLFILGIGIGITILAMSNSYTNALMEMCPDHEKQILVECNK